MFMIMKGPTILITNTPNATRNVQQQVENRNGVVVESEVPSVRKSEREEVRTLDEGKRAVNGKNLASNARRVQDQEQVVPEEEQP